MDMPLNGLAALLRTALGTRWQQLHPDIRARFTLTPGESRQSFTGTMREINRSRIGWLIAHLIAFVRILPATRARDVPFEFNLSPVASLVPASSWIKERLYHFQNGRFEFRSIMSIESNGEQLIEQFAYGLGMKIKLGAEGNAGDQLIFRDDGYFLRLGRMDALRLPLPCWLTVGRFTLIHQNIDRDNFTVEISLDHPWFGRLFYQVGSFIQAPVVNAMVRSTSRRFNAPDKAHKAVPGTAF
jgi:hypothetical protein